MALSDWSENKLLLVTGGVVGGVLVIMAGLDFYVYWRYSDLKKDVAGKRAKLRTMETDARKLDKVREERDRERALAERLDKVVPDDERMDELSAQLTEQANQVNLTILRFEEKRERTRGRARRRDPYEPIGMELRCKGGYDSFGRFVNLVEDKMDRFVEVKGFKIKAYNDGLVPGKKALDITIKLEARRHNAPRTRKAP
ncbi:MAG: type 4a pilus biogenesis protein PilO [Planctomycetota bacterium]